MSPTRTRRSLRLSMAPLLLGAFCGPGCGAPAAAPPQAPTATPASSEAAARATWEQWRRGRHASLTAEDGWLSLIALGWLDAPQTTVGSDPSATIVLPSAHAPAAIGVLTVRDGQAYFQPVLSAGTTHVGAPVTGEIPLRADDPGPPTELDVGPIRMHVIARGGRLGLRVRDRQSPAREGFHGPEVFDYDMRFRLPARFEAAAAGQTLPIVNVLGQQVDEPLAGQLRFTFEGTEHTLLATWSDEEHTMLGVMLRDVTSDEGSTYGAGRYLEVPAPRADRSTTIDFNFAYTPPCGYTAFATCPLPPSDNELSFAIEAGERAPEGH